MKNCLRKIAAVLLVAPALLLASCKEVTVEEIQRATVQACNFLPTAVTIASFIPAAGPYLVTANAVAGAICDALQDQQPTTPMTAKRRGTGTISVQVFVAGASVSVQGRFVR
jgi:predicted lipoprotein